MARSFNGSTDVIKTTGFTIATPFTFFVWCICNQTAAVATMLSGNTSNTMGLRMDPRTGANDLSLFVSGAAVIGQIANAAVTSGTWFGVVASYDSSGNWAVYATGLPSASGTNSQSFTGSPLWIGQDGGTAAAWTGNLADVAVWNVILSATEAKALTQGIRPGVIRPKSLKYWLPLDGNSSPEPDLSGNASNGTLTGTAKASGPPFAPFTPRWPLLPAEPISLRGWPDRITVQVQMQLVH